MYMFSIITIVSTLAIKDSHVVYVNVQGMFCYLWKGNLFKNWVTEYLWVFSIYFIHLFFIVIYYLHFYILLFIFMIYTSVLIMILYFLFNFYYLLIIYIFESIMLFPL